MIKKGLLLGPIELRATIAAILIVPFCLIFLAAIRSSASTGLWPSEGVSTSLTIITSSLVNGAIHQPYDQPLQATGGATPYTWQLLTGALPSGLSLNPNGSIAGTPIVEGTYNFEVRVTDASNQSAQRLLSISVALFTLTINPTTLPTGTTGQPYPTTTLTASGGLIPYRWSFAGHLPPGLQFDPESGVLSGTAAKIGVFPLTLSVDDTNNRKGQRSVTLTITSATIAINLRLQGLPEESSAPENEEVRGAVIPWNMDDDNDNGLPDAEESGTIANEDDLIPVSLFTQPTDLSSGTLTLSVAYSGASDLLKVWTNATKASEVILPRTWNLASGTVPQTLYIEGVGTSSLERDIELQLTYVGDITTLQDRMLVSVHSQAADSPGPVTVPPHGDCELLDEAASITMEAAGSKEPDNTADEGELSKDAQPEFDPNNFVSPPYTQGSLNALGPITFGRRNGGPVQITSIDQSKKRFEELRLARSDRASGRVNLPNGTALFIETLGGKMDVYHPQVQYFAGTSLLILAHTEANGTVGFAQYLAEGTKCSVRAAGATETRTWVPPRLPILEETQPETFLYRDQGLWVLSPVQSRPNLKVFFDTPGLGGAVDRELLTYTRDYGLFGPANNVYVMRTGDVIDVNFNLKTIVGFRPQGGNEFLPMAVITWGVNLEMKVGSTREKTTRTVTFPELSIRLNSDENGRTRAAEELDTARTNRGIRSLSGGWVRWLNQWELLIGWEQGPALGRMAHLAALGDTYYVGNVLMGTTGESRRLEGWQLWLDPPVQNSGIEYQAHLQGAGNTAWIAGGTHPVNNFVGTRGLARPVEGFRIRLTGTAAANYRVKYMAHLAGTGNTPVRMDGELCGTEGVGGPQVEAMWVWMELR